MSRINSWPNDGYDGPGLISRTNSVSTDAGAPNAILPYCEINKYASLEDLSSFRQAASYLPVYNEEDDESLGAAHNSYGHTGSQAGGDGYAAAPDTPARPLGLALLLEPPDLRQVQDRRHISSLEMNISSSVASSASQMQLLSSGSSQPNAMAAVVNPVQPAPTSASQLSVDSEESGSHSDTRTCSSRGPGQAGIALAASSVSSELSGGTADHWDIAHAAGNHELEPVQQVQEDILLDHFLAASMPIGTEATLVYASVLSISRPPSPSAAHSTLAGFLGVRPKSATWPLKSNPGMKRHLSDWGHENPTKRVRTEDRHGVDAAMAAS